MQNPEEPQIQNWADYIDALHSFRAPWPGRHKSHLQKLSLEEESIMPRDHPSAERANPQET